MSCGVSVVRGSALLGRTIVRHVGGRRSGVGGNVIAVGVGLLGVLELGAGNYVRHFGGVSG